MNIFRGKMWKKVQRSTKIEQTKSEIAHTLPLLNDNLYRDLRSWSHLNFSFLWLAYVLFNICSFLSYLLCLPFLICFTSVLFLVEYFAYVHYFCIFWQWRSLLKWKSLANKAEWQVTIRWSSFRKLVCMRFFYFLFLHVKISFSFQNVRLFSPRWISLSGTSRS